METFLAGIGWFIGCVGFGVMMNFQEIVAAWERVELAKLRNGGSAAP